MIRSMEGLFAGWSTSSTEEMHLSDRLHKGYTVRIDRILCLRIAGRNRRGRKRGMT